jgi:hypothetical protein
MAQEHVVLMVMLHPLTPRDRKSREQLSAALPDATVGEPDETGVFEVRVEAEDREHALTGIWEAVAASATDDHIAFLEHPELPQHWRHLSSSPVHR